MNTPLTSYEKAGRVIRLLAWIQVVAITGIIVAIIIPMLVERKAPPPQSFFVPLIFPPSNISINPWKGN